MTQNWQAGQARLPKKTTPSPWLPGSSTPMPIFSFEREGSEWDSPAANGRAWDLYKLFNQGLGLGRDQMGFAQNLEGARQNNIMQTMKLLSPGNKQAQVDQFRKRMMANAKTNARQNSLLLQSRGMGSGAVQGAELDANNQAALATADYDAQLNSPESQLMAALGLNDVIGQGQSNPIIGQLLQLFGGASETDRVALQRGDEPSFLDSILGTVGTVAGFAGGRKPKPQFGPTQATSLAELLRSAGGMVR